MGGFSIIATRDQKKTKKEKKDKKDKKKEKDAKVTKSDKKADKKKDKKASEKKKITDKEKSKTKTTTEKLAKQDLQPSAKKVHMTQAAKILQKMEKDSIEEHRHHFDKDNIEEHRKEHEQDLQLHSPEWWYDEESLEMDLESMRRKPWYKGVKDQATVREQLEECDPEEAVQYKQWLKENVDKEVHDQQGDQESNETDTTESDYNSTVHSSDWNASVAESSDEESVDEESKETEYEIDEHRVYLENIVSLRPKSKVINLEDDGETVEYCRQSVERLEKIEELRRSRLEYQEKLKAKLEESKQRRKERQERAQRQKASRAGIATIYSASSSIRSGHPARPILIDEERESRQDSYSQSYKIPQSGYDHSKPTPFLVDLTDICDRTGTKFRTNIPSGDHRALQSMKIMRWKSSFKEEIPVIVDFTNERKPQQILDLTKLSDPPLQSRYVPPPRDPSPPRRVSPPRYVSPPRNVSPPRCNRRLDQLRKEREENLQKAKTNFKKVAAKDKQKNAVTTYHRLMDKVTCDFKRGICG